MKIRIITLLLLCFCGSSLLATPKIVIDVDSIKQVAMHSPDEYRLLLNRFVLGDTTMTLNELAVVYYGAPHFRDFVIGKYEKETDNAYRDGDYNMAYLFADAALKENPASLDLLIKAIVSATNINDVQANKKLESLRNRFYMISWLLVSSGTGVSPDKPYLIALEQDKLRFLYNVLEVIEVEGETSVGECDAFKVKMKDVDNTIILFVKTVE